MKRLQNYFRAITLSVVAVIGLSAGIVAAQSDTPLLVEFKRLAGIVQAQDPDKPMPGEGKRPPVPTMTPSEMDALIEQKKQEAQQTEAEFLEEFANGTRQYSDLPIVNSDLAPFAPAPTLPEAVAQADVIVSVTSTDLHFEMSSMAGMPRSRAIARIDQTVKGQPQPGAQIEIRYLGGPFRQPTGEEFFFQLQQTPIPRPSERLVLLLRQKSGSEIFGAPGPWDRFDIQGGRVVPTNHNPLSQSVAGLTEEELLNLLASHVR